MSLISKATTLDGKEEVQGYVSKDIHGHYHICFNIPYGVSCKPIQKDKLKHSHDGGKTFYSSEEINRVMEYLAEFPDRFGFKE